jgi:hypothetical protein
MNHNGLLGDRNRCVMIDNAPVPVPQPPPTSTLLLLPSNRAQMALAKLVPISGPKKVLISGPTPSNAPCYGLLPHPNPYVPPHIKTGSLIFRTALNNFLTKSVWV